MAVDIREGEGSFYLNQTTVTSMHCAVVAYLQVRQSAAELPRVGDAVCEQRGAGQGDARVQRRPRVAAQLQRTVALHARLALALEHTALAHDAPVGGGGRSRALHSDEVCCDVSCRTTFTTARTLQAP